MSTCDICERSVIYTVRLDVPNLSTGAEEVYACGACRAGIATYIESYTAYVRSHAALSELDEAGIRQRQARQEANRLLYRFVPSSAWQIADNDVHIFSTHKTKGGLIGYIEARFVMNFLAGDTSRFRPISGWQYCFSAELIERLGLSRQEIPHG